jgi:hypothetical protein
MRSLGVDGVLHEDPTSFEGTIARRIDLLRRVLTKVGAQPGSAADTAGLVDFILGHVTVDTTLTASTLRSAFATIDQVGPTLNAYNLNNGIKETHIDGAVGLVADPATVRDVTHSFLSASSSDPGSPNPGQAITSSDRQC